MSVIVAPRRFKTYASFIKLEHTIFSLPLIFAGVVLHARRWPSLKLAGLILLAAVGCRVMAMGLNRIIDVEIDARNPRTQRRELPHGAMHQTEAWAVVALATLLYLWSAVAIAPICLWLSPVPLLLFAVYPYLKRFTSLSHFGLGLAWSMGPLAGWLAASRSLRGLGEVGWLWLFSILWVTAFDIIYSTMDEVFDREAGLHSLPAMLGKRSALRITAILHALAFLSLLALWRSQLHSLWALPWLIVIGALFMWQDAIAERQPEFAFFHLNGLLGFLAFGLVLSGSWR